MGDRIYVNAGDNRRLRSIFFWHKYGAKARVARMDRHWQHAGYRTERAVKREFADEHTVRKLSGKLSRGCHQRKQDRQIVERSSLS